MYYMRKLCVKIGPKKKTFWLLNLKTVFGMKTLPQPYTRTLYSLYPPNPSPT